MAKSTRDELFERLRVGGLRKKVAKRVADGLHGGQRDGAAPKAVQGVVDQLKTITAEIEDRAKGGPAKRRSRAAHKAAATRKRKASERRASARKGARTRAKAR
ncbi:MAG TPA: hypothetical protein VKA57_11240 [Solirubrobacteraceae bacterium]|nr:hypothetical protein [Solirubrobacteraceae bacterium]